MAAIYIYDEIGPDSWGLIGGQVVAEILDELAGEDVLVRINSPGGSVGEALTIRQLLADYDGYVEYKVDAIAASAATLLNGPHDRVTIGPAGRWMIHDPWSIVYGSAPMLRDAADRLDDWKSDILDLYGARVGDQLTRDELSGMMLNETLMNSRQAVEAGFVDAIDEQSEAVAACWRPGVFSKQMDALFAREPTQQPRGVQRRQKAARAKCRRGPNTAFERDRLARMRSPAFWEILNRKGNR